MHFVITSKWMIRFQQHRSIHWYTMASQPRPQGLRHAATLQSPFFEVTHGAVRSWQRICHVGLGQKIWKMFIHLATWQTWQILALIGSDDSGSLTILTGSWWKNSSNFRRFWNWLGSKGVDFAYMRFL